MYVFFSSSAFPLNGVAQNDENNAYSANTKLLLPLQNWIFGVSGTSSFSRLPAALAQKLANAALQCGKIHRLCKMAVHPALCRKPLIFHKSIGGKCKQQHGLGVRAVYGFFFRVNLLQ